MNSSKKPVNKNKCSCQHNFLVAISSMILSTSHANLNCALGKKANTKNLQFHALLLRCMSGTKWQHVILIGHIRRK